MRVIAAARSDRPLFDLEMRLHQSQHPPCARGLHLYGARAITRRKEIRWTMILRGAGSPSGTYAADFYGRGHPCEP